MLSRRSKRVAGITALLAGVLIMVLGVVRPDPFADTRSIWAEFDSVQGLGAIGRDVRLAGVNVGTVGRVVRDGDDARVELVLDEGFPVHRDASAQMRPHTLFEGSSFVELAPGSPGSPLLGEGDTIPKERTTNYVTLDDALRILRPEIRENLKELARVGSRTLRGETISGLQRTLKAGPSLMRSLKRPARALQGTHRNELAGAIAGMSRTVDALASREEDLGPLVRGLNRTTRALATDGARPLDSTVASLPGVLAELRSGAPLFRDLIDRLERLGIELTPVLPDFTTALEGATPLLERSVPIVRDATPLIGDTRRVAERLADASPDLEGLIRTLRPVTKVFGGSVLPTLLEPSRTGPPTYQQLLATFTAANAVFRPYQTPAQNPLGSGHAWSIGTYIDTVGPLGAEAGGGAPAPLSCAELERISRSAARDLSVAGGCQ